MQSLYKRPQIYGRIATIASQTRFASGLPAAASLLLLALTRTAFAAAGQGAPAVPLDAVSGVPAARSGGVNRPLRSFLPPGSTSQAADASDVSDSSDGEDIPPPPPASGGSSPASPAPGGAGGESGSSPTPSNDSTTSDASAPATSVPSSTNHPIDGSDNPQAQAIGQAAGALFPILMEGRYNLCLASVIVTGSGKSSPKAVKALSPSSAAPSTPAARFSRNLYNVGIDWVMNKDSSTNFALRVDYIGNGGNERVWGFGPAFRWKIVNHVRLMGAIGMSLGPQFPGYDSESNFGKVNDYYQGGLELGFKHCALSAGYIGVPAEGSHFSGTRFGLNVGF